MFIHLFEFLAHSSNELLILSCATVDDSRGATKTYDSDAAVQIVVFDTDQWVSYDDWESFETKMDWANSHCLGG